jgi:hypothetical protein
VNKLLVAFFAFISILVFEQSCQKIDTTDLGAELIPTVDNINTFDTLLEVISGNTFIDDSTRIGRTEDHALGFMEDPEFGKTYASLFFEVLPSASGYPFVHKDSLRGIDSVVLSMQYTGLTGDSNARETIHVYEIAQSAELVDSFYSIRNPEFPVVNTSLGNKTVLFSDLNNPQQIKNGTDTNLVTLENTLRIHLDKSLGTRLASYDTSNAYKSDSLFRTFFKGLAVKVDSVTSPNKKALAYFKLNDNTKTRLTVYFRALNNGLDTTSVDFIYKTAISQRSANIIRRNIVSTNYAASLAATDINKEKLYVQSTPGSMAKIYVPGLKTLSNRLIYKAELVAEKLPAAGEEHISPPFLFLDLMDSANNRIITIQNDMIEDGQGSYNFFDFGGQVRNNKYSFNLTRHIQGIITRKNPVYTFRLYAPYETFPYYVYPGNTAVSVARLQAPFFINNQVAKGRVVLGGGNHPAAKMYLRIIYSKI